MIPKVGTLETAKSRRALNTTGAFVSDHRASVDRCLVVFVTDKKHVKFFLVMVMAFFFTTAMQTSSSIPFFQKDIKHYSGKTKDQKRLITFGPLYKFALRCKEILPGKHKGELLTDIGIPSFEGYRLRLILEYFLFPIDISAFFILKVKLILPF